jgi:xylulokinase
MAKLLGVDVGTSGCKAVLINEKGRVLAQGAAGYPLHVPRPLWAEQDPASWWDGVQACLRQVGEPKPDAIGLTGQMHGAVFLDARGEVVRPAILWCDQRTAAECALIDAMAGADRVRAITCNPPLTGFQTPKVLWMRRNEPERFARVRSVLLPKDYVRLRLTGVSATEVSDASGTGLFDVPRRRWSEELMRALELDPDWFPPASESHVVAARTNGSGGLSPGIPVVGGGGDQAAGAVGTGAVEPGVVSVSVGTSGVVFTALDRPSFDPAGAAHTFCHANGAWHAMGVMLACGGAVRWLRDALYPGESYESVTAEASAAPAGCDGLTFLPYLTGERTPHNDPEARGVWAGLTLGHGRGHLARAVFEGATFGLLDGMARLGALGATASELRVTGGGAKSAFWMQMIADAFGKPCLALEADEGPAYGAAILAGVGAGAWPNVVEACRATVRPKARLTPSGTSYAGPVARFRALYPALKSWQTAS